MLGGADRDLMINPRFAAVAAHHDHPPPAFEAIKFRRAFLGTKLKTYYTHRVLEMHPFCQEIWFPHHVLNFQGFKP